MTLLHKVIVAVVVASSSVVVAVSPSKSTVAPTDPLQVFGQRMAAYRSFIDERQRQCRRSDQRQT